MARYTIIHRINECIGCGSCAAVCPDFWEMGNDGKAHIKGGTNEILDLDTLGCNKDAAEICPVQCIEIKENKE